VYQSYHRDNDRVWRSKSLHIAVVAILETQTDRSVNRQQGHCDITKVIHPVVYLAESPAQAAESFRCHKNEQMHRSKDKLLQSPRLVASVDIQPEGQWAELTQGEQQRQRQRQRQHRETQSSASEVTTLWRYRSLITIIIIIKSDLQRLEFTWEKAVAVALDRQEWAWSVT